MPIHNPADHRQATKGTAPPTNDEALLSTEQRRAQQSLHFAGTGEVVGALLAIVVEVLVVASSDGPYFFFSTPTFAQSEDTADLVLSVALLAAAIVVEET